MGAESIPGAHQQFSLTSYVVILQKVKTKDMYYFLSRDTGFLLGKEAWAASHTAQSKSRESHPKDNILMKKKK